MTTAPFSSRVVPDELHDKLVRAADVFAERGLDATRIADVTRATGIPRATLYYYFPGKEHILAHLLNSTLHDMKVEMAVAAAVSGTGQQRLIALVRAHLAFIATRPAVYRLLLGELGRAASLVDIGRGVDEAISSPIRALLRAGHADGTLHVPDVGAAAVVVYGASLMSGLQHLVVANHDNTNTLAERIITVILDGLAPLNSPAPPATRARRAPRGPAAAGRAPIDQARPRNAPSRGPDDQKARHELS